MGNTNIKIPLEVEKTLDKIVNEFGINVIKQYITLHNKKQRKKFIRHNTREDIVKAVYELIVNYNYSKVRAIERIANEKAISEKTINNHLYNFEKEAKENNFFTYGFIYDELKKYYHNDFGLYNILEEFANKNNLDKDMFYLYYLRYKSIPKKNKHKYKLDFTNIKAIKDLQYISAIKEHLPETEHTINQEISNTENIKKTENIDLDDEIHF